MEYPYLPTTGKKIAGQRRGDHLVDDQGNTHAIGSDARRHQFRQGEPYANARTHCIECNKAVQGKRHQPAMHRVRHGTDVGMLNFERSRACRIEVDERVTKEGLDLARRKAALPIDVKRYFACVPGTEGTGGRRKSAIGVNDRQRQPVAETPARALACSRRWASAASKWSTRFCSCPPWPGWCCERHACPFPCAKTACRQRAGKR